MTGEGREHGEQIPAEVVENGGAPSGAQGGDAEQQIAGVRDAGIAEQALHVALRDGAEIAVENGDARDDDQQVGPLRGDVRHRDEEHAQQQHEARSFGADRQKRRGRRGRALVNVRRPDLEGKGGDFESQPGHHEHQPEEEDLVGAELAGYCGQVAEVERVPEMP